MKPDTGPTEYNVTFVGLSKQENIEFMYVKTLVSFQRAFRVSRADLAREFFRALQARDLTRARALRQRARGHGPRLP